MQRIPEEQRLVAAARGGDRAAFEQLYQACYPAVYALAYSTVRERNTAEAILRDTFSAARSGLDVLPTEEPFGRWVQRIAFVQCDAYLRRTGRPAGLNDRGTQELLADADPETFRLPLPYTTEPELQARLERVVSRLPGSQRCALTLYYNNALAVEDAAVVMGVRPETVRSDLALARREIVRSLRESENAEGRPLPWGVESETTPYRNAAQVQLLSGMIAGGVAGLILDQVLAASAGSAAAASAVTGTAAVSTVSGTAVGMSTAAKVAVGAAAVAVVAGGTVGVIHVVKPKPVEPPKPAVVEGAQVLDSVRVYDETGTLTCTESYDYDANCFVIRAEKEGHFEGNLPGTQTHVFTYDAQGRATSAMLDDVQGDTWEYDENDRLTKHVFLEINGDSTEEYYAYGSDGNRAQKRVVYNMQGDRSEEEYSCTTSADADGGKTIEMDLMLDSEVFTQEFESYDAQGRLTSHTIAEAQVFWKYRYLDEKLLTLCEIAAGNGPDTENPSVTTYLVLLDSGNTLYYMLPLGDGADAQKTYDDNGLLTRLDFSNGGHAEFTYRSAEAPAPTDTPEPSEEPEPSETPESTDTPEPTPAPKSAAWKDAYRDYVEQLRSGAGSEFSKYSFDLVYVDGDDIPELLIYKSWLIDGAEMCTYSGGSLRKVTLQVWGVSYLERGGIIQDTLSRNGSSSTIFYSLQGGTFSDIGHAGVGRDEGDWEQVHYYWNDEEVSEETYNAQMEQMFPSTRAIHPGTELNDYATFLTLLENA